jgi:hypothetical protein
MTKKFEWNFFSKVPDHTQEALERYFLYAMEPGRFLRSVLVNDLYSSVARADTWNKTALADIVTWIAENAPEGSWGHEDYYREWIAKGPAYERFQKSLVWEALNADHTEAKDYDF